MAKPITPEYLARSGTEHGEQAALFCWAASQRAQHPELAWMFAIPNGGGRTPAQAGQLKAEGVKSGVADVCLPVVRDYTKGVCPGLYIEMKKAKGVPSDVSAEQLAFGVFVLRQGYVWLPCFGWEQARTAVLSYLNGVSFEYAPHQLTVMKKAWDIANAQNSQVGSTTH